MRSSAFTNAGAGLALAIAAALAGCGGSNSATDSQIAADAAAPTVQTTDIKVGTGISPRPGQNCIVHYTGWLYVDGHKGAKFDSSLDRKKPLVFVLGEHQVIEGWEKGVSTMKVGGKRTIIVPPSLGYGSKGMGTLIPPNATLIFEVELINVTAPTN